MKEFNLNLLKSGFSITEAEREEGIVLKIDKDAFSNGVFVVRIGMCTEEERNQPPIERATIPGHPNCYVGDCIDCHNVSCAIYQGYEEMP